MKRNFATITVSVCLTLLGINANAQARILPLGDSVTSSFSPHNSYRCWLWYRLVNNGYNVDFVGTQYGVADGAPSRTDWDQDHDGHPGWTTQDALDYIDSIAAATQPDVVLIDLGSNDLIAGVPVLTIKHNLKQVIRELRAVNPNVAVFLAMPSPYQGMNRKKMGRLRNAIAQIANNYDVGSSPVFLVDLARNFSAAHDTFDGQHPNGIGERKIAADFYSALSGQLHN